MSLGAETRLREAHHRIVDRQVTVRVVFADNVTDRTRRFHMRTVRRIARFVHRIENTTMNRLQTIANVRKRTRDDNAHRIFKERSAHLASKLSRVHGADGVLAFSLRGGLRRVSTRCPFQLFFLSVVNSNRDS